MSNITLTEIKKDVKAKGGEYRKLKMYLNGSECWEVNGKKYTKAQMVEAYKLGEL